MVATRTAALCLLITSCLVAQKPWTRHTIDDTSKGADGTRMVDMNDDGRLDIVTAWEEGGIVRVYLNPGTSKVKKKWPAVTVGRVKSGEDAMGCDVDGDGNMDVVSCTEGKSRAMFIHWGPGKKDYLNPKAWTTTHLTAAPKQSWMFVAPLRQGGKLSLVAGSKGADAAIGILVVGKEPRNFATWEWRKLRKSGWIMTIEVVDMDGDGGADILYSDRKGARAGIGWLRNPGATGTGWEDVTVCRSKPKSKLGSHMFLSLADVDRDGRLDIVNACKPDRILWLKRLDTTGRKWKENHIAWPGPPRTGDPKAAGAADVDGDGKVDLILSCEHAKAPKHGVFRLSYTRTPTEKTWQMSPISGPQGLKFDMVKLIDLDGDGDLDLVTCEERTLNAVVWYENPLK